MNRPNAWKNRRSILGIKFMGYNRFFLFLLLCVCLCTSFHGHSQDERVFIDYGACTKGLIINGDTVIPASFEDIRKTWFPKENYDTPASSYWIVTSGSEQGLINNRYELIVPLGAHTIQLISDSLAQVTKESRKFQIIHGFDADKTSNGALYRLLEYPNYQRFLCATDDSSFLYNYQLELLQSFPYPNVRRFTREITHNKNDENLDYFIVSNKKDYGIYGIVDRNNSEIIPLEYNTIQLFPNSQSLQSKDIFFKLSNQENKVGMQNLPQTFSVPCLYSDIQLFQLQEYPEDVTIQNYAYLYTDAKVQILHINTEKKSQQYDHIHYFEGFHYARKGSASYILNDLLEPIDSISGLRYYFGRQRATPQYHWDQYPDSLAKYARSMPHRVDGVIFISDSIKHRKDWNKMRYQLRDIHTGATSEEKYQWISITEHEGDLFYRGYNQKRLFRNHIWKASSTKKMDVYDSNLKLTHQYSISDLKKYEFASLPLLQFKNKNGKTGIIYTNGDVYLPFEFEQIKFAAIPRIEFSNYFHIDETARNSVDYDSIFIVTQNGKQGILSVGGKSIIPADYTSIRRRSTSIEVQKGDSIFTYNNLDSFIVNHPSHRRIFISKARQKRISKKYRRSRKRSSKKQNKSKQDQYQYFEHNDTLFVQRITTDSNYQPRIAKTQDYEYNQISQWIVDKQGKIVYTSNSKKLRANYYEEYFFATEKNRLITFDSVGNVHLEKIPKNAEVWNYANQLVVTRNRKKSKHISGLYNLDTKLWGIPVKKNTYIYLKPHQTVLYGNYTTGFKIVDFNGNKKLDYTLRNPSDLGFSDNYIYVSYPENESRNAPILQGLLDTNFQLIIAPNKHLYLYEITPEIVSITDTLDNITLLKKDSQLQLGNVQVHGTKENIIVHTKNDSIALLDFDLNFILPKTHNSDLVTEMDLLELYNLSNDSTFLKYAQLNKSIAPEKQRLIKNLIYLPFLKGRKIYSGYNTNILANFYNPPAPTYFDTASVPSRLIGKRNPVGKGRYTLPLRYRTVNLLGDLLEITAFRDTLYSIAYPTKIRVQDGKKTKLVDSYGYYAVSAPYLEKSYYALTDTALIPLEDFRFYEQTKQAELNALLLAKLNEAQALGLKCNNIPAEIDHLATHYSLEKDGVRFSGTGNKHSILIYYFDLLGIWKHPSSLTLDKLLDESP